jgi:hypothetical protein
MWQVLDIVARFILLGGFVFIGWFVWQIVSAPKSGARSCVCCGGRLSEYDLANCYKCLSPSFGGGSNA